MQGGEEQRWPPPLHARHFQGSRLARSVQPSEVKLSTNTRFTEHRPQQMPAPQL